MKSNLKKYIDKRLSKLSLYYNRIVSIDLYLKLDNFSSQTNKFVELRVNIPGEDVAVGKKVNHLKSHSIWLPLLPNGC